MDIHNIRTQASDALSAAPGSPRRLTLIHTAAALGLSLLMTVINFILIRQIDNTAGLHGIGTRTVLDTVRVLVTMAGVLVLPIWELGYTRAALSFSRREQATPATLFEGFRRFWPALRLLLLRTLVYGALIFFAMQLASLLYLFSPWSLALMEAAEPFLKAADAQAMETALQALMPQLIPLYILVAITVAAFLIPVFYRLRLAEFAIMDSAAGALAAMRISRNAMKGNCVALFRLDLRFWWYYGLLLLSAMVALGDLLLPLLGWKMSGDAAMFVFYLLSLGLQLLLTCRFAPLVQTTYATFYHRLIRPGA